MGKDKEGLNYKQARSIKIMHFEDGYGEIKYMWDTQEGFYIFVYDYNTISVRAKFSGDIPKIYLIRKDKYNRQYFNKDKYRVYIDELEEYSL